MAPLQAFRLVRSIAVCATALAFTATCRPHTDGLTDLLDNGHSYVEFPGRRVLSGNVTRFGTDTGPNGAMALGIRGGRLVMAPFDGGAECDAGAAADFVPSRLYAPSGLSRPFVPFIEPGEPRRLRFAAHDCSLSSESVSGGDLPLLTRFDETFPHYLTLGASAALPSDGVRALTQCRLWDQTPECRTLASVNRVEIDDRSTWTVELDPETGDPLLVFRDTSDGDTIVYTRSVRELVISELGRKVAFTDDLGLMLVARRPDLLIGLEDDACSLHAPSGRLQSRALSYRAPCDGGNAIVYDIENDARFELSAGALPPALLGRTPAGERAAFYLTDTVELPAPDGKSRVAADAALDRIPYVAGTLWGEPLGSRTPVRGPDRALLATLSRGAAGRLRVIADFDGMTGRLVEWNADSGEIFGIARGVAAFEHNWALADFDGNVGTLLEIRGDGTTRALASGVPDPGSEPLFWNRTCYVGCFDSSLGDPTTSRAVLSSFDGVTGTLLLFTQDVQTGSFGPPESIADGVPRAGFRLLYGGDALLYLTDYRPELGTGTLNARFVRTADTFTVSDVSTFREVTFPDAGVIYVVPEGPRAGVWYARLR